LGTRFTLFRPGVVDYVEALALQRRAAAHVRADGDETLILLQHPPTYTLGVRGRESNVLASEAALAARGAVVIRSDRGGDVTFHGPGQVVGYPIVNLRARGIGPATYVRMLEQTMIDALAQCGIDAERSAGRPGVWVNDEKIGAIGVRVSGGVATHGFALNVNTDLSYFTHIIPCGLNAGVTSVAALTGREYAITDVEDALAASFAGLLDVTLVDEAPQWLEVTVGR
jgi:lipoate-protein ligase B